MNALIVSGLGQETIPHKGLVKFWEQYLSNYEPFFTSYADPNFRLEGMDIVIGHSLGSSAVYNKIQMYRWDQQLRVVFFDTVESNWKTENLDVDANVQGVSVVKDYPHWWQPKHYPPSCKIKGPQMSDLEVKLGHNALVSDDTVQRQVAELMNLT